MCELTESQAMCDEKQKKYVSKVTANLGDQAFDVGKSKITPDLFSGGKDKL